MGPWERLSIAVLFTCAGCGAADDGASTSDPSNDAGLGQLIDGAATQLDATNSASGNDAHVSDQSDAANVSGSDRDATVGGGSDAAALVLEIPTSTVACGASSCDTLENVCCSSWSRTAGFGTDATCVARNDCYNKFDRTGDTNRAVTRECDGKEDCSAGQICCVYADGAPLFADLFNPVDLQGPGGSTICTDVEDCTYNNTGTFVGSGIPLGEIECNDDTDCTDRAGTSCQPELSNSHSTGTGVQARADVKVCR